MYKIQTVNVNLKISDATTGVIDGSESAVAILRPIFARLDDDQEHFIVLVLNSGNRVTAFKHLFSGGMGAGVIDMKIVFRNALLMGGASIITAHNHPSRNLTPSSEDLLMTKRLVESGTLLGINVLDHIILDTQSEKYLSLSDEGMM